MKKAFVVVAMLAFAVAAHGQYSVELDLNGTPGDGPDYVVAAVSDYITGDLWIHGPVALFSFGVIICNYDGSLEFQGAAYATPAGWTNAPVAPGECVTVQATDFNFATPLVLPYMVATLTFHAAVDQSIDDITFGDAGWLDINFMSGVMDNQGTLAGTVQIGETSTEESSWGAVKGLFR